MTPTQKLKKSEAGVKVVLSKRPRISVLPVCELGNGQKAGQFSEWRDFHSGLTPLQGGDA